MKGTNMRSIPDQSASELYHANRLAQLGAPIIGGRLDDNGDPDSRDMRWKSWQKARPGYQAIERYQPGEGLGMVTGVVFDVIDVDPRSGGLFSWKRLCAELGEDGPEEYWRTATSSGGFHVYIAPLGIGTHTGFMPGLDLKAGGGFVFIPPTARPSKADTNEGTVVTYRGSRREITAPDPGDDTGEALRGLIERCMAKKRGSRGQGAQRGRAKPTELEQACYDAKRGEQHDALLALVDELARKYDDDEYVVFLAWRIAQDMTTYKRGYPWTEADVRGLLHKPGRRPVADASAEETEELRGIVRLNRKMAPADEDQEGFWDSRKELRLIREWARARRAGPWAVLGEVLAGVVCHTPPSVVLPPLVGGYGTLNMLLAITGKSGEGKGTSAAVARDAVRFEKSLLMARPDRVPLGSGEGLAKTFGYSHKAEGGGIELVRTAHSAIVTVTEIDNFAALGARNASTLSPQIRQLYSGEDIGFGYSGADKRVIIPAHSYRACLVAGVQPGRGEVILGDTDGGFAQRWLWLNAVDPQAPDSPPAEPDKIEWALPEALAELDPESSPHVLDVAQVAVDEIDAARLARLRGQPGDDLDAHSYYTRLKVAAALGLLAGRDRVTAEDWELSGLLMRVSDACRDATAALLRENAERDNRARGRAEGVRREVASHTEVETRLARVGQNLLKHIPRDRWIGRGKLRNKIGARDRDAVDEALALLETGGKIRSQEVDYQGQTGTAYRRSK